MKNSSCLTSHSSRIRPRQWANWSRTRLPRPERKSPSADSLAIRWAKAWLNVTTTLATRLRSSPEVRFCRTVSEARAQGRAWLMIEPSLTVGLLTHLLCIDDHRNPEFTSLPSRPFEDFRRGADGRANLRHRRRCRAGGRRRGQAGPRPGNSSRSGCGRGQYLPRPFEKRRQHGPLFRGLYRHAGDGDECRSVAGRSGENRHSDARTVSHPYSPTCRTIHSPPRYPA